MTITNEIYGQDIDGNRGSLDTSAELDEYDFDEVRELIEESFEIGQENYDIEIDDFDFTVSIFDYFSKDEIDSLTIKIEALN